MPAASSVGKISGRCSSLIQCSWTFWRVESSPSSRPKRCDSSPIVRSLLRRQHTAGNLDPHHKVSDLRTVVVQAVPHEANDVVFRDVLVTALDQLRQLVQDLIGELFPLEPLNRVPAQDQIPGWRVRHRENASGFSATWRKLE